MTISSALGWLVAIALTAAACATTVRVPEIPVLDSPSYKKAIRDPDPKPSVKIIEVPKPLPLPGQLKPVPEKKDKTKDDKQPKDEKPPKERVKQANADARIESVKDG
jgi:type IV secretion system protein VirB9